MENMNNSYGNQGFEPEMPVSAGQVSVNDIFDSPYYMTYLQAWDERFMLEQRAQQIEAEEEVAAEKQRPVRRLFPMLMIFLFSLVTLAIAVMGVLKISALAGYTAFSGNAAYADVLALMDCFTRTGEVSIEAIFGYVLPVALFLSLALALLMLILSLAAMCSPKSRIGMTGLSLIVLLLGILATVSLYIVMGAPELATKFFAFGGEEAIGYGLIGILGCELLAFLFSLFANRPAKKLD
jgi:hypothetical protein